MEGEVPPAARPDPIDAPEGKRTEAVALPPMSPEESRRETEKFREQREQRTTAELADKQGPETDALKELERQMEELGLAPAAEPAATPENRPPAAENGSQNANAKKNGGIEERSVNDGFKRLVNVMKEIVKFLRTIFPPSEETNTRPGEPKAKEKTTPSSEDVLDQESALKNIDMNKEVEAVQNPMLERGLLQTAMGTIRQQQRDIAIELELLLNSMKGREPTESERSRFVAMKDKQQALRTEYESAFDRSTNLVIVASNRSRGIFELSRGLGYPRETVGNVQLGEFVPGYAPEGQAEKSDDIIITFKDASALSTEQRAQLASLGVAIAGNTGTIADPPPDFWTPAGRVNPAYATMFASMNGSGEPTAKS